MRRVWGILAATLVVAIGGVGAHAAEPLNSGVDLHRAARAHIRGLPEPSAWIMMLVGVGGVGVTLRRRGRPSPAD